MKKSRTGIAIAIVPGLLLLGLFYSLALHMYKSLGGWPSAIGENGFPRLLITHARITVTLFQILLVATFGVLPFAAVICLSVERWRRLAPYLALFGLTFLICLGLMQLAPHQFLYWWAD